MGRLMHGDEDANVRISQKFTPLLRLIFARRRPRRGVQAARQKTLLLRRKEVVYRIILLRDDVLDDVAQIERKFS
jgi:hypothetical protein